MHEYARSMYLLRIGRERSQIYRLEVGGGNGLGSHLEVRLQPLQRILVAPLVLRRVSNTHTFFLFFLNTLSLMRLLTKIQI